MRRCIIASAAALAIAASVPATAQIAKDEDGGVTVRRPSLMRNLVSAARLEKAAEQQYAQLRAQAVSRKALLAADDPVAARVHRIAKDLLPHAHKWNRRAKDWRWETIVIKAPPVNALCMPGGKIAVFTGALDTLKLTDDELAMVIGHEMAHALREHARARAAKTTLTNVSTLAVGLVIGGNVGELARQGGGLLSLQFNRNDERDADLVGLELAARAGYDPAAGITLWQKMGQVPGPQRPTWLSTHPSSEDRLRRLRAATKDVARLYEKGKARRLSEQKQPPEPAKAPEPPKPVEAAKPPEQK
jgi:predicted Zn-dependent protease